jgi:hypothetical protein
VFNLECCQLLAQRLVHDDHPTDGLMGSPKVTPGHLKLTVQQIALVTEHVFKGGHTQLKTRIIDQIIFHQARTRHKSNTVCVYSIALRARASMVMRQMVTLMHKPS